MRSDSKDGSPSPNGTFEHTARSDVDENVGNTNIGNTKNRRIEIFQVDVARLGPCFSRALCGRHTALVMRAWTRSQTVVHTHAHVSRTFSRSYIPLPPPLPCSLDAPCPPSQLPPWQHVYAPNTRTAPLFPTCLLFAIHSSSFSLTACPPCPRAPRSRRSP